MKKPHHIPDVSDDGFHNTQLSIPPKRRLTGHLNLLSLAIYILPLSAGTTLLPTEPVWAAKWGQSGKGGDGGFDADRRYEPIAGKPNIRGQGGDGGASGAATDFPDRNIEIGSGGNLDHIFNEEDDHGDYTGRSGTTSIMCNVETDACKSGGSAGGGGGGAAGIVEDLKLTTYGALLGGQGGDGALALYKGSAGEGGAGGAGIYVSGGSHVNDGTIRGGIGGNGGDLNAQAGCTAASCISGRGGDGGAGIVGGEHQSIINNGRIIGGLGGRSGQVNGWNITNPSRGGNGGDGGHGIELGSDNLLENNSLIQGGKAGIGIKGFDEQGAVSGIDGEEGIGVYARGNQNIVINKSNGVITAGGEHPEDNIAVKFEGNDNTLEIHRGSLINGLVEAQGANNALNLGGDLDQDFDISQLDNKYKGFNVFSKNGEATVSITGTSNFNGDLVINRGIVKVAKQGRLANFHRVTSNANFDVSEITDDEASIQSLSGDKAGQINLGGRVLILTDGHSDEFAGTLSGDKNSKLSVNGGHQILSGDNAGFTGQTSIENNGRLTVDNNLGGTVNISDKGILDGVGRLENLVNEGSLAAGRGEGFGNLRITGDYLGREGSNLFINTRLGDDASPTSRLYVGGNTSGHTNVTVYNRGGLGGQTGKGIKIIDIGGQSNADFTLNGDYHIEDGREAVIGGAYAYLLFKGQGSDPADGNWYLRSQLKQVKPEPKPGPGPEPEPEPEIFQPGVPLYSSYGQVLGSLNRTSSLQQRVGNRYWRGLSTGQVKQGDGAGQLQPVPDAGRNEVLTTYGLFWSQTAGHHTHIHPKNSTTVDSFNLDSWNITAGVDNQLYETDAGRFIGGVWFQYGTYNANISSGFGRGKITGDSYGGGAALTWYGNDGLYVDGQTRLHWYNSELESEPLKQTIVKNTKAFGYTLSLEGGWRFTIDDEWSLIPQGQLSWLSLNPDSLTDKFGAISSFKSDNQLIARAGLAANYADNWQGRDGYTHRLSLYGGASFYQTLVEGAKSIDVSGVTIDTGSIDKSWAGIGAGGTYSWQDDKYSLYGNINTASSLKSFGKDYIISANIGLNVKW